jgi:hypothetical protein
MAGAMGYSLSPCGLIVVTSRFQCMENFTSGSVFQNTGALSTPL